MRNTFILFVISLCFFSCVEEFKVPNTVSEKYESELVIQGRILSGEKPTFYLSMTSDFGDNGSSAPIEDATITIIGQNGYESKLAEYDRIHNQYTINTVTLPQNTHYAVKVILDGETYQSDFQELQSSPEIDEITYKEKSNGISIHVSTHDDENGRRAYMWTYEEDWEFHANINMFWMGAILYNSKIYPGTNIDSPYYFCWGHNDSYNIHIYSTEKLKENRVPEYKLLEIPIDDIRISYIYSILVKQWSLSDEAYNYFRIQKLYTEESSGLFTPMPTEVQGNMKCTSNPDIKVRGYVLASTITSKRIFIYEKDLNISSEYENCKIDHTDPYNGNWIRRWTENINAGKAIAVIPSGYLDENSTLYYQECFDCRTVKGATKKRPDFWPNDHE